MSNRTFAIIKPDAVKKGFTGTIYDRIITEGFNILGAKLIRISLPQAQRFYAVHKGKPFYEELTEFMSSSQSMVLALEKENAVSAWRETIGATNPEEAAEGTIRRDFATSIGENAVYGSDSDENDKKEIGFFFSESELITNQ
ncbi:MAG: nucleoside-diphosphate kinase [Candidatus Marinimicrobia bacterium]|nr:nucleoside-diphosphate kinase [Candidatus Neomarinimicrobiota bacterium]